MRPHFSPDEFSPGDLIAFSAAILLTILLLVLSLRAAKLPGSPRANILFAICGVIWSIGGLLGSAFRAAGGVGKGPIEMAKDLQLTGAAVFPFAVLLVWRQFVPPKRQRALRVVGRVGIVSIALVLIRLWLPLTIGADTRALPSEWRVTAWNTAALLLAGAVVALRRRSAPRAVYLPSLAMVACACGAAIAMPLMSIPPQGSMWRGALDFLGAHLILVAVLCAFFLFARFRYADVFVHYGARIVLAGIWAGVLAGVMQSSLPILFAMHLHSPGAAHILLVVTAANCLLLSFTFLDERVSATLNRWLFRTPDYAAESSALANRLREARTGDEAIAAAEESARAPLELSGARVIAIEELPRPVPQSLLDGSIAELDPTVKWPALPHAEALIPISSNARVSHALAVAPGVGRPGLVSAAFDYLRGVAAQCGRRLDALRTERETVERERREAMLLQHVAEAELNALRAQLHPHFLFNSLNTIADQIVRDPKRAEEMTLRLARVFRHVLEHLRRPLTTVREEIDFLRTYLSIEEARFGDRLQVEIEVDSAAAGAEIPSLILQPLVENALKHGLGPKTGPGRLWITARVEGDAIRMTVEDDGLGPQSRVRELEERESAGVGLANVAERLRTLYRDRAGVRLEAREGGGSRATVTVPRPEAE